MKKFVSGLSRKFFLLSFLLICFAFFSCSDKEKETENLIERTKMEAILTDCYMAESYIASEYPNAVDNVHIVLIQDMYADIFEKHGVTKQEFEQSYSYYSRHAKDMEDMLQAVIVNLEPSKEKKDTLTEVISSTEKIEAK